jgi:hypothetical protein
MADTVEPKQSETGQNKDQQVKKKRNHSKTKQNTAK